MHRGWSMTEEDYDEFRLCEVIDAAAKIFAGTEKAACDAGIIQD